MVENEGGTQASDHRGSAAPRPAPLDVRVEDHHGTPVVHVRGELDLSTCDQVETALAQSEGGNPPTSCST